MIDRIVLFKLLDPAQNTQVAQELKSQLAALPGLVSLSVGLPADAASRKSWDVSCVLSFADLPDHDRALASATFKACIDEGLLPKSAVIKAWSFDQK